jgi:two-component system cell cycle response regulator DivK
MPGLLIIGADPRTLKLLALLLTGAGHAVMFATDVEGGLLMARFRRPALIVMDVSTPGMDGLAAAAVLGADAMTADIPILSLSGTAISADRVRSRRARAHARTAMSSRRRDVYDAIDWLLAPPAAVTRPAQGPA